MYLMINIILISRMHHFPVLPAKISNNTPALRSGYCIGGSCIQDEHIEIQFDVEGTIYHSLRLVVDNNSVHSTKVYLDRKLVGSFQEHFEPILTGGVFVVNSHQGGGLFKNFVLKPCNQFDVNGACIKGTTLSLIIQKIILILGAILH